MRKFILAVILMAVFAVATVAVSLTPADACFSGGSNGDQSQQQTQYANSNSDANAFAGAVSVAGANSTSNSNANVNNWVMPNINSSVNVSPKISNTNKINNTNKLNNTNTLKNTNTNKVSNNTSISDKNNQSTSISGGDTKIYAPPAFSTPATKGVNSFNFSCIFGGVGASEQSDVSILSERLRLLAGFQKNKEVKELLDINTEIVNTYQELKKCSKPKRVLWLLWRNDGMNLLTPFSFRSMRDFDKKK